MYCDKCKAYEFDGHFYGPFRYCFCEEDMYTVTVTAPIVGNRLEVTIVNWANDTEKTFTATSAKAVAQGIRKRTNSASMELYFDNCTEKFENLVRCALAQSSL